MADPDRDYRIGRKLPRHYYQPAERIELVPGVTRKEINESADLYAGSAEALERAGVLRAHMLPAPGHVQISWNPVGVPRAGYGFAPGYLEIRRHHDGTYRARLTVSDAERKRREQLVQQRRRERLAGRRTEHGDCISACRSAETWTPEKLRELCIAGVNIVRATAMQRATDDSLPLEFTESARERIAHHLAELETAIAGAQIVSKRHVCGGKGHLRVAWSAS